MLYLTCTTISSVDLAQYGVSLAKDWVSVECGTMFVRPQLSIVITYMSPEAKINVLPKASFPGRLFTLSKIPLRLF